LYTQQALQEADNIIAFCNASRLMVLESGVLDEEGFGEMEAELTADMRGQSEDQEVCYRIGVIGGASSRPI
jgi:hypothetical protein